MSFRKWLQGGDDRRGSLATAIVILLFASGVGLIAVSIAAQERAPSVAMAGERERSYQRTTRPDPWAGTRSATRKASGLPPGVKGPILPASAPVSLDIPSIDVHSDLQHLGQTAEGALETPAPGPRYDEAAWYRFSPAPGSVGPAVVLGHIDSASGGPSVFFRLGELQRGDRVSIERADGSTATFEVDFVRRYAKNDFPTRTVYGDIDHAGLRLLTCGGAFDDATGHYLDNIVVFASLTSG